MDYRAELLRLQHQVDLASRAIARIGDRTTVRNLESFAKEIKGKLDELQAVALHEEIRRRAFGLWQEAGRPEGRDLEFWLRAEQKHYGGIERPPCTLDQR
ncbi:DUF2934 domain-containing protein [Bradyrhizobium sp. 141]|uniref:DUF2934 domain-containing protein n=1 Tax=Bradyrhizobium sp. 141 TaxID=2782617 RepID=UPI001FF93288|nr:DUF2934 domain-containing protein [Bradyrhizobium sp. 141]MCK1719914.1 DUF2934 domain-containing protein [Bradyrhizobium sp. 141]